MSDVIKLDYELAEDMIKAFNTGREQLQDVLQEVHSIANALEDGVLLGRSGAALVDTLRTDLGSAVSRLSGKFDEMSNDVKKAVQFMQEADNQSQGLLK